MDLESSGGSGFWVGENGRITGGNRKGQFASTREQRWTDPDTEGGFQVSRQGEQREQGKQGEQGEQRGTRGTRAELVHKPNSCLVYVCDE